jgi:hypothetical protein
MSIQTKRAYSGYHSLSIFFCLVYLVVVYILLKHDIFLTTSACVRACKINPKKIFFNRCTKTCLYLEINKKRKNKSCAVRRG